MTINAIIFFESGSGFENKKSLPFAHLGVKSLSPPPLTNMIGRSTERLPIAVLQRCPEHSRRRCSDQVAAWMLGWIHWRLA